MTKSLHTYTIKELSSLLGQKKVSSVELAEHFKKRIEQFNPDLNAFVHYDFELSMTEAKQADAQIASGNQQPLTGIPIGQKDIFCSSTRPTTCGSKALKGFRSTFNATVISRCEQVGMVNMGSLNMDEFAMGSANEYSCYGPVSNPWDHQCSPGGSSGGSAAAVSARLVPCATGTDTGGSIRQPAAFTGITGIKPTYGRVSRRGMIAFASSLDQAGPLTHTAYDAAMLLNGLCGHDPYDSTSSRVNVPDFTKDLDQPLAGIKIGLPKECFGGGVDLEIGKKITEAIQVLTKLGAEMVDVELPTLKYAIPTYYLLAPIECASNLARFDGVHYGYRCDQPKNILDLYEISRDDALGDEVKRRILIGTFASSSDYSDKYYQQALLAKKIIRSNYKKVYAEVDAILTPTTTTTAFNLGVKSMSPEQIYLSDIFTVSVNLAGLPGISVPIGFNNKGMPIGMQFIGNRFCEATILRIAHQYQNETDWHTRSPDQYK